MGLLARLKDKVSNAGEKIEGTFIKSDAEMEVDRRKEMDERRERRIRVNEENYKKTYKGKNEEASRIEAERRERQRIKEAIASANKKAKDKRRIEAEDERKLIQKTREDAIKQAKIEKAAAQGREEGSRITTKEYLNKKLNPKERWKAHIKRSTEVQSAQEAGSLRGERYSAMQSVIRSNMPRPSNYRRPYSGGYVRNGSFMESSSVNPYTGQGSMNQDPYFAGFGSTNQSVYQAPSYTQTYVPPVLQRSRETQYYQLYFGTSLPVIRTNTTVGNRPKKYDTFFGWK